MAKKREETYPPLTEREKALLDNAMLQSTANTLVMESRSATTIAQALHIHAKESHRLLAATKHLVAIAKKYLANVPYPEDWMYGYLIEKHGVVGANREVARRDKIYGKILRDAKKLLARREAQRASEPELLAIRTFIDALQRACDSYRPH